MDADSLLDDMLDADGQLYERILDTPGFALAFNRLTKLARDRDALLAACRDVAAFDDCEDAADWKDAYGRLVRMCRAAVAAAESPQ